MSITRDFRSIRLRLASPEQVHEWSHGEVIRPETINYRTQKPEKDGLFCERIFGPTKDWECYCGKYKRIRYKGIVCDKCGVEVTRSIVRRERMGHIDLAVPVAHIWFLRGIPSKIGLILDLSGQALEKVVYFAGYIITEVDENAKGEAEKQIKSEYKTKRKEIETRYEKIIGEARKAGQETQEKGLIEEKIEKLDRLGDAFEIAKRELRELHKYKIVSELEYRDLSAKYGHVFSAGIGAEAVRKLLEEINLDKLGREIEKDLVDVPEVQKKKLLKRLRIVKGMIRSKIRPEWMIVSALPVIPPDIRPMVPLDGGRYAASDLNDLYRRVINRNNRLSRLQELAAPEVIQRNEKRMLQEAVDALIDNSARRGKAVQATTGQKRTLKSLADMLKGKQGRFRQNLLGKRVDYSGRSVIVVGPKLKISECGLPKKMALELFKPFVISDLIKNEQAHNVRSAGKLIEQGRPEVWDSLDKVIAGHHVLLNRAPTLHRLGIQAFQPVLIEGKAIQLHPAVCAAFNADFDGDQMAVHVPLTKEARKEAATLMLSELNLLKPADGTPVATADKDVALGCFYLTVLKDGVKGEGRKFASPEEALLAYHLDQIDLRAKITVRRQGERGETSAGRLLLNSVLPKGNAYLNEVVDKKKATKLLAKTLKEKGMVEAARLIDNLKDLTFGVLTESGFSLGLGDFSVPAEKPQLIASGEEQVEKIRQSYKQGLLTDEERYERVVEVWTDIREQMTKAVTKAFKPGNALLDFIESGARGKWGQTTQIVGLKGLVNNPSGRIIELPIKSSFKEGFSVLEYFIATHGTRKGLADTALRTASSGYLTRRLVDVSQDVVIHEEDCGDTVGAVYTKEEVEKLGFSLGNRVRGRFLAEDIKSPQGKIVAKAGILVDDKIAQAITDKGVTKVRIRSVLGCQSTSGICQKCYGLDLGRNQVVALGQAVGVVAAQSIGEPGTQLTMRTFHTGGIAATDITQGLPRVAELFEARTIKSPALISEVDGKAKVSDDGTNKKVQISGTEEKIYTVPSSLALAVADGDLVTRGQILTEGHADLREIIRVSGWEAVKKYVLNEVLAIYAQQGMELDNKHVEIIIRQMLSRILITDPGDSEFIPDEVISKPSFDRINKELVAKKKKPAQGEQLLMGISKAALSTDSFLSAASFQETARVLIDAAIMGKKDELKGLKENVIIGKLLPAGTGYKQ